MVFISKKLADEFGKDYVKILYRELRRADKVATGALINSIDFRLRQDAKDIMVIIESNDYLKFVDEGRKPGKYPPVRAIRDWVKIKGISEDAVWPIMKSIYKFGIKPLNIIQRVTQEFETSPTLTAKYEDEIVDEIISQLNIDFKGLNEKYK
jgi:hypothetical protein